MPCSSMFCFKIICVNVSKLGFHLGCQECVKSVGHVLQHHWAHAV